MKSVLMRVVRMIRRWMPMLKQELGRRVEELSSLLEKEALLPPQNRVEYSEGIVIRVGSIGCAQRCEFGAAK